jgi:dihydroflavonol-4-reductase
MSGITLVTGATGFLGRHVTRALVGRGATVRALVRQRSRALGALGVEQVLGDVEDPATLLPACAGVATVYHLAGVVSRVPADAARMMAVHVGGTRHLLAAMRAAGVRRLILASTSGTRAVSKDEKVIATEDAPYAEALVAGWPYYLSKLLQEKLTLAAGREPGGPEVVALLPSLLLGPGDTRGSSTEDVLRFLQRRVPSVPPGGLSLVDVRDVADAFVAAGERGRAGERYLLGAVNWSFATYLGRLERLAQVPGPRLRLPARWARLGGSLLDGLAEWRGRPPSAERATAEMSECFWYLDASKAARELGFVARDPQETLVDTIRDLRTMYPT